MAFARAAVGLLLAGCCLAPQPQQPATQPAESAAVAEAETFAPHDDETRREYVRRLIRELIEDGRAMGEVRALRDHGEPGPMLERQHAHFDRSAAIQAYAVVAAREVDEALEFHISELGGDDLSLDERQALYDRPDSLLYAQDHWWLFNAVDAIEAARLCGSGQAHTEALAHCDRAEALLVEPDARAVSETSD